MSDKKPYTPPQVFRVELDQNQTILSACSMYASNLTGGGASCNWWTGCKRTSRGRRWQHDQSARPS